MLHPKHNRIEYGQLLSAPDGYDLTKAIGTTYSLDLDILMVMPVAMLYAGSLDRSKEELRIDVVDSLVNSASRIFVYYQEGKLKVPRRYHFLMAFWEKSLHAVRMPQEAASFHPKIWVMRFDDNDSGRAPIYRVIVTSRNLTSSNDHDIVFETEGVVSNTVRKQNVPLIAFLQDLNSRNQTMDDAFIADLARVDLQAPDQFEGLSFHPIGIGPKYPHPLFRTSWKEMLVISPFLDRSTVGRLVDLTEAHPFLLSTQAELSCLKDPSIQSFSWQFSNYIENSVANEDIAENDQDPLPQSLHAKFYIGINDSGVWWYTGSANCTAPADSRNIEFLIGMRPTIRKRGPQYILEMLTSKEASVPIFETFNPCDTSFLETTRSFDLQVRSILYKLFALPVTAIVKKNETSGKYNYRIRIDLSGNHLPDGFSVAIRPVSNPDVAWVRLNYGNIQQIDSFKDYPENLLSPYLAVVVKNDHDLVKSATWVIPIELPSTRLNKIFSSIINSRERFMQYLQFLLNGSNSELDPGGGGSPPTGPTGSAGAGSWFGGQPIFEDLLVAVSRDNKKLAHIRDLIKRLQSEEVGEVVGEKIISDEFVQFWQIFEPFIKDEEHA